MDRPNIPCRGGRLVYATPKVVAVDVMVALPLPKFSATTCDH